MAKIAASPRYRSNSTPSPAPPNNTSNSNNTPPYQSSNSAGTINDQDNNNSNSSSNRGSMNNEPIEYRFASHNAFVRQSTHIRQLSAFTINLIEETLFFLTEKVLPIYPTI